MSCSYCSYCSYRPLSYLLVVLLVAIAKKAQVGFSTQVKHITVCSRISQWRDRCRFCLADAAKCRQEVWPCWKCRACLCVFGIKKFLAYLYGYSFTLITDHKALLALKRPKQGIPPQASTRIQRWAITILMCKYTIVYMFTTAHGNAETMNRLPLPEPPQVTPLPPEMILLMEE